MKIGTEYWGRKKKTFKVILEGIIYIVNKSHYPTTKYLQGVRQFLINQLNGENKIQSIDIYGLPVVRFLSVIIIWPQEEMEDVDVKVTKLQIMHEWFQSRTNKLHAAARRLEVPSRMQHQDPEVHSLLQKSSDTPCEIMNKTRMK